MTFSKTEREYLEAGVIGELEWSPKIYNYPKEPKHDDFEWDMEKYDKAYKKYEKEYWLIRKREHDYERQIIHRIKKKVNTMKKDLDLYYKFLEKNKLETRYY